MKEDPKYNDTWNLWNLYKKGGLPPVIASVLGAPTAQQMAFVRWLTKEQRKQSPVNKPIDELEFAVVDLETTGFSPSQGDEIISVGAVLVRGRHIDYRQSFYSLVNPRRDIPANIVELTGITNEMAERAPDLLPVLQQFLSFVRGRILIFHGGGHDKAFLNAALWKTSRSRLPHRFLDTMILSKWLHPEMENHDLDSMLKYYGIPVTVRHHALEDAKMTSELWVKLAEQFPDKKVHSLQDLYDALSK